MMIPDLEKNMELLIKSNEERDHLELILKQSQLGRTMINLLFEFNLMELELNKSSFILTKKSFVKGLVVSILFVLNSTLLLQPIENIPEIVTFNLLILNVIWFQYSENFLDVILSNATVVLTDNTILRIIYSLMFLFSLLLIEGKNMANEIESYLVDAKCVNVGCIK